MSTKVNKDTGEITIQECEDYADIEAEFVSKITAYAASLETKQYDEETPQSDEVHDPAKERAVPSESASDASDSSEGVYFDVYDQ